MKKTSLHSQHVLLNATMVDFAGFDMPIKYTSIKEEHNQVRTSAGLFDVSHMGEICVKGKEAAKLVDLIFTNNVLNLEDNQVIYGQMCYENGFVVDDLLVYKFHDEHFLLVVNASNVEKDFDWVMKQNKFDCKVTNKSHLVSEIALQGPKAQEVLQKHTNYNLNDLKFFYSDKIDIDGYKVLVSRTGYTGEDGFEIYSTDEIIVELWKSLLKDDLVKPIGLGARDTLRFEVNLPLYGHELTDYYTPLESGFSMFVDLDKEFIGSDVLRKQKGNLSKRLCGLKLLDKGILRHGYKVFYNEDEVGVITTGYKSISTSESVALAMVDKPYFKLGSILEVEVRNKRLKVEVVKKRFYKKSYKK